MASLSTRSAAQEITVAAAADMGSALTELAARYQKKTGTSIRLLFGSSGNLTQQIKNGAPFDLFRSEERRVGKECRSRWSAYHEKTKVALIKDQESDNMTHLKKNIDLTM